MRIIEHEYRRRRIQRPWYTFVVELHQDGHDYTRAGKRERDDSYPDTESRGGM